MSSRAELTALVVIALGEGLLGFLGFALVLALVSEGLNAFSLYVGEFSYFSIILILISRLVIYWLLRFVKISLIKRIASGAYKKLLKRIDHESGQEMKRFLVGDIASYISGYNSLTTLVAELAVAACLLGSITLIELNGEIRLVYFLIVILLSVLFQLYHRKWLKWNTKETLEIGSKYQGFIEFVFSDRRYISVHEYRFNFMQEIRSLGTNYLSKVFERATFKALLPYVFETIGLVVVVLLLSGLSEEEAVVFLGVFARLIGSISRVSSSYQGIIVYKALKAEYYAYSRD